MLVNCNHISKWYFNQKSTLSNIKKYPSANTQSQLLCIFFICYWNNILPFFNPAQNLKYFKTTYVPIHTLAHFVLCQRTKYLLQTRIFFKKNTLPNIQNGKLVPNLSEYYYIKVFKGNKKKADKYLVV